MATTSCFYLLQQLNWKNLKKTNSKRIVVAMSLFLGLIKHISVLFYYLHLLIFNWQRKCGSLAGETTWDCFLSDASFACRSRDEQESRCGAGDGFHVVFVVIAIVSDQQVVEDAHDAHEEQEAEDALPKQVARSAANRIREREKQQRMNLQKHEPVHSPGLLFLVLPLWGLSHVSHKVLLPHHEIDDSRKGSRSYRQRDTVESVAVPC